MRRFEQNLDQIWREVLHLASLVEERIGAAIQALCDRRPDLADDVIRGDAVIDQLEVRIEEECLNFLARHDPLAGDLRRIAAVLKINHELERMADEAVSIARRARSLDGPPLDIPIPRDLQAMSVLVAAMVRGSLDAFIDADVARAREVIARDDDVDRLHRQVIDALKGVMQTRPHLVEVGLDLFSAAGHLERIADHATNISEEVIYITEGSIIRHRHEDAPGPEIRVERRGDVPPVSHALRGHRI